MSVRLCLSHDLAFLPHVKFVYFNENSHCCHGGRQDVTCSRQKCYVKCSHNIINDMTLFTE